MPTYSQLKKFTKKGLCPICLKTYPLYLFSQQGGIVARSGRPTSGLFAKEERELHKPIEWSAHAYCSFPCFMRGLPTHRTPVWILKRREGTISREVSRHTTPTGAQKALVATIALSDSQFYVQGPKGETN